MNLESLLFIFSWPHNLLNIKEWVHSIPLHLLWHQPSKELERNKKLTSSNMTLLIYVFSNWVKNALLIEQLKNFLIEKQLIRCGNDPHTYIPHRLSMPLEKETSSRSRQLAAAAELIRLARTFQQEVLLSKYFWRE